MVDLMSVRGRKYGNIFSLVPFANNVYTTNKIWRSQPKSVRTGSAWLKTNSTPRGDHQTGGVRKEAYEKPKRLSTLLRSPQYKGTCWIAMDYTRGARGCVALRKVLPIRTFVPNAPKTEDF